MPVTIPVRIDVGKHLSKYNRIRVLMENDETAYGSDVFCLDLPNEPSNAKKVRKNLLQKSFKNITNDLLGATKDAIFHEGPRLEFDDNDSNPLSQWSKNITLGGENTSLMTYAADTVTYGLRAYGHVWTVMDKPDKEIDNMEEELKFGAPYTSNIYPGNVLNYEIVNGDLVWFAYKYPYHEPWLDPLSQPPPYNGKDETRIWTQTQFIRIVQGEAPVLRDHKFGFVPVVYQSFILPPDETSIIGISPFFDSSNMIIYANNMQSVADMELFKHGSSVLLVQEDSVNSLNTEVDEDGVARTKTQDSAGYNKYVYSGEQAPEYLTKDLEAVDKASTRAKDLFMDAIQNERTLQSIYKKRDTVRESGETKVYDAEPTNAGLRATSQDLESWCTKVLNMSARMLGREELVDSFVCEFPDRYIVGKSADEKFKRIEHMIKTQYPSETGMREAYKSLTPEIAHDNAMREIINKEIENADINVDYEGEIEQEMKAEQEFEESIKDLSEDEKKAARAKRKLDSEGVE